MDWSTCLGIALNAFEAHVHSEFIYCQPKLQTNTDQLLKPHNASRSISEREPLNDYDVINWKQSQ